MRKLKELRRELLLDYWIGLLAVIICIISIFLFFTLLPCKVSFVFTVIDVVIAIFVVSYFFTDASNLDNEIDKVTNLLKIPCEFSELPVKEPQNIIDAYLRNKYLKYPILAKRPSENDYEHIIIQYDGNKPEEIPYSESKKIFDYDSYK